MHSQLAQELHRARQADLDRKLALAQQEHPRRPRPPSVARQAVAASLVAVAERLAPSEHRQPRRA